MIGAVLKTMEMDDGGVREIFFEVQLHIITADQDMTHVETDREIEFLHDLFNPFKGIPQRFDGDPSRRDPAFEDLRNAPADGLPPGLDLPFLSEIEVEGIERGIETGCPFDHLSYDRNSFCPDLFVLVPEKYVDREMDMIGYLFVKREIRQNPQFIFTREIILSPLSKRTNSISSRNGASVETFGTIRSGMMYEVVANAKGNIFL
jgi:hypothetical protein